MGVKEKLIELLTTVIFVRDGVEPAEAIADFLIDNGVTIQKWISVKDGLPTKEDADEVGNVQVVFYGRVTTWRWDLISIASEITHWMPLPELPKKGGRA